MKPILMLLAILHVVFSSFGQIENFSWLMTRDGRTYNEVSDLYIDGSVLSAGVHDGVDIDPGVNSIQFTATNSWIGGFVQKLYPDGTLEWAHDYSFADGRMEFTTLCIDINGNSYIGGSVSGKVDLDPNTNGYELDVNNEDLFIISLDSYGNFRWAVTFDGSFDDVITDLKTDIAGNLYVFGQLNFANVDFDPGSSVHQMNGRWGYDCFIEKLTTNGNFIWAKRTMGTRRGRIEVDNDQNIYIANTVFHDPVTDAGDTLYVAQGNDLLIQKISSNGDQLWNRMYSNADNPWNTSLALDQESNLYFQSGFFHSLNVDPDNSDLHITSSDSWDVFIQKIDSSGNMIWTKNFGGFGQQVALDIAISADNNLYSAGRFFGSMDFDPSSSEDDLYATSLFPNGFLSKFDLNGNFQRSYTFCPEYTDNDMRVHCDSSGGIVYHGKSKEEFMIETNLGPKYVPNYSGFFLLKFGDSNLNDQNHLRIGLSPNPINNYVFVEQLDYSEFALSARNITIRVYDGFGSFLFEVQSDTQKTKLDMSKYRIGAYFIEVTDGSKSFVERVVKVGKQD